jgi:hypothetical protein
VKSEEQIRRISGEHRGTLGAHDALVLSCE